MPVIFVYRTVIKKKKKSTTWEKGIKKAKY